MKEYGFVLKNFKYAVGSFKVIHWKTSDLSNNKILGRRKYLKGNLQLLKKILNQTLKFYLHTNFIFK